MELKLCVKNRWEKSRAAKGSLTIVSDKNICDGNGNQHWSSSSAG